MKEQLSDEIFHSKYTLVPNHIRPNDNQEWETYGEELDYVRACNPDTIWTIIDNNDGWYGIVAGYHYVNRMSYLVTVEPWTDENEEYTIYDTTELREQWDKLPKEAIMEVCGIEYIGDDPDELELYKDDNFYEWEEMSEQDRDNTLAKYNIV